MSAPGEPSVVVAEQRDCLPAVGGGSTGTHDERPPQFLRVPRGPQDRQVGERSAFGSVGLRVPVVHAGSYRDPLAAYMSRIHSSTGIFHGSERDGMFLTSFLGFSPSSLAIDRASDDRRHRRRASAHIRSRSARLAIALGPLSARPGPTLLGPSATAIVGERAARPRAHFVRDSSPMTSWTMLFVDRVRKRKVASASSPSGLAFSPPATGQRLTSRCNTRRNGNGG